MEFVINGNVVVSAFYYGIVLLLAFFSAFGMYILIRYGTSRAFALVTCLVYSFIFLNFLTTSYQLLLKITP